MRVLLDRGARVNNALSGAVDDYNMVKFLLSRGAKIIVSRKGLTVGSVDSVSAISSAAGSGSIEVLRMLLSHADEADIKGSPEALNCAAASGQLDCLNVLIDHGFDVNAFTKGCWIEETPLLAVCHSNKPNPHVLKTLLDKGANTSIQASNGDTPRRSLLLILKPVDPPLTSLQSPRHGSMERPLKRPTTLDRRRRHIPP